VLENVCIGQRLAAYIEENNKKRGEQTMVFHRTNGKSEHKDVIVKSKESTTEWHRISTASFDCDLQLAVIDMLGTHALVFPVGAF
jgi:hypothetical protein